MQSSQAVGFVSRLAATGVLIFSALTVAYGAKPQPKPAAKPPFEITEHRPRCSNYNPQRQAFFGTTHLHTGLSFDASIRFVDYVGIELGQLAFVGAVLLVAAAFRKLPVAWPRWAKAVPAYGIGAMAAFWFLQRAVDLM